MKKSNAPQKPTKPPMPKCKPPKDDWEIPSFMKNFTILERENYDKKSI